MPHRLIELAVQETNVNKRRLFHEKHNAEEIGNVLRTVENTQGEYCRRDIYTPHPTHSKCNCAPWFSCQISREKCAQRGCCGGIHSVSSFHFQVWNGGLAAPIQSHAISILGSSKNIAIPCNSWLFKYHFIFGCVVWMTWIVCESVPTIGTI